MSLRYQHKIGDTEIVEPTVHVQYEQNLEKISLHDYSMIATYMIAITNVILHNIDNWHTAHSYTFKHTGYIQYMACIMLLR